MARVSSAGRFGNAVLSAGFALVRPPRAHAVAVVDDVLIIGLVVLGSMGVSYLANSAQESGAADYLKTKLAEYLTATGKAVSSFVDTVTSYWYDQYQEVKLSAQQAKEWYDFVRYLAGASAGGVEIFDDRIVLDGMLIYLYGIYSGSSSIPPTISVQVGLGLNWNVTPFPSYPGLTLRAYDAPLSLLGELKPHMEISCDGVKVSSFHNSSTSRSVDCWFSYEDKSNQSYFCAADSDRWFYSIAELSPEFTAYLHGLLGETATASPVEVSNVDFGLADRLAADDIVTIPGTWAADDVLTGVREGTLAVPHAVVNAGPVVGDLPVEGVDVPSLGALFTTRFPFSIPLDLVRAVKLLSAPPIVPHWEVDFLAPLSKRVGGWRGSTKIVIDFSDYEVLGALCRWVSTILFCAALISGTKKLIWS